MSPHSAMVYLLGPSPLDWPECGASASANAPATPRMHSAAVHTTTAPTRLARIRFDMVALLAWRWLRSRGSRAHAAWQAKSEPKVARALQCSETRVTNRGDATDRWRQT